jgi:hypothetical protein
LRLFLICSNVIIVYDTKASDNSQQNQACARS